MASGCAIVTTKGPPAGVSSHAPPDCTTSKAAVYVDGIVAGAAVGTALFLGIAALAKQGQVADGESNDLAYATLYTFLGGVGFSLSGIVGGVRVNACRQAHETWQLQPAPSPPYPAHYPPQSPPGYGSTIVTPGP
jgi:hypothetical protein